MTNLLTLKGRKDKLPVSQVGKYAAGTQTTITDMNGNIKAVFPVHARQPRKGQKTIVINCFTYNLIWD